MSNQQTQPQQADSISTMEGAKYDISPHDVRLHQIDRERFKRLSGDGTKALVFCVEDNDELYQEKGHTKKAMGELLDKLKKTLQIEPLTFSKSSYFISPDGHLQRALKIDSVRQFIIELIKATQYCLEKSIPLIIVGDQDIRNLGGTAQTLNLLLIDIMHCLDFLGKQKQDPMDGQPINFPNISDKINLNLIVYSGGRVNQSTYELIPGITYVGEVSKANGQDADQILTLIQGQLGGEA